MKYLEKLSLQTQLMGIIFALILTGGAFGIFLLNQTIFQERYLEQIVTAKNDLNNFEQMNKMNLKIFDFHEILRNLDRFQFHTATIYVGVKDANSVLIAERWIKPVSNSQWNDLVTNQSRTISHKETLEEKLKVDDHEAILFAKPIFEADNAYLGELVLLLDLDELRASFSEHRLVLLSLLAVSLCFIGALTIWASKKMLGPLTKFTEHISMVKTKPKPLNIKTPMAKDIRHLIDRFNKMVLTIEKYEAEATYQAKAVAIGKVATQVAHDIRSPLSSVQAATEYLGQMRIEDPKAADVLNLLELSAKRLTGIADDLLKHKAGDGEKADFSIHQVLDELLGEFQGQEQYQKIRFFKQYSSKAIHVRGNVAKIQRAFGNIIKNAAEAMQFEGSITLSTQSSGEKAIVSLSDTGPGMSPDKLERVLQGGFTEGKTGGHGIGMKMVKETVEYHGGKLWGESTVGKGTSFFIELPQVDQKITLNTFSLSLHSNEPVLIIDDDASLREQWRLILKENGLKTILCDSMEDYLGQKISSKMTQTAIVDYHYDNSEKNGANIIQYLKETGFEEIYLCTAEYWKPSIQKLAEELGVKLCPKPLPKIVIVKDRWEQSPKGALAEGIPSGSGQTNGTNEIASVAKLPRRVSLGARNDNGGYTVLVIDDDRGIRMSWEMMQKKLGIARLHSYSNLEALQKEPLSLTDVDIAFVDKNIEGSNYTGAQVINYLRSQGVSKIVLASGESEEELRNDPQFSEIDFIIGKQIPTSFRDFFAPKQ